MSRVRRSEVSPLQHRSPVRTSTAKHTDADVGAFVSERALGFHALAGDDAPELKLLRAVKVVEFVRASIEAGKGPERPIEAPAEVGPAIYRAHQALNSAGNSFATIHRYLESVSSDQFMFNDATVKRMVAKEFSGTLSRQTISADSFSLRRPMPDFFRNFVRSAELGAKIELSEPEKLWAMDWPHDDATAALLRRAAKAFKLDEQNIPFAGSTLDRYAFKAARGRAPGSSTGYDVVGTLERYHPSLRIAQSLAARPELRFAVKAFLETISLTDDVRAYLQQQLNVADAHHPSRVSSPAERWDSSYDRPRRGAAPPELLAFAADPASTTTAKLQALKALFGQIHNPGQVRAVVDFARRQLELAPLEWEALTPEQRSELTSLVRKGCHVSTALHFGLFVRGGAAELLEALRWSYGDEGAAFGVAAERLQGLSREERRYVLDGVFTDDAFSSTLPLRARLAAEGQLTTDELSTFYERNRLGSVDRLEAFVQWAQLRGAPGTSVVRQFLKEGLAAGTFTLAEVHAALSTVPRRPYLPTREERSGLDRAIAAVFESEGPARQDAERSLIALLTTTVPALSVDALTTELLLDLYRQETPRVAPLGEVDQLAGGPVVAKVWAPPTLAERLQTSLTIDDARAQQPRLTFELNRLQVKTELELSRLFLAGGLPGDGERADTLAAVEAIVGRDSMGAAGAVLQAEFLRWYEEQVERAP